MVDGQLRLISATPTTTSVATNEIYLNGANGYNNAVYLIDNSCKILYNSNYASKVQNLKIEDIQEYLTYDYTKYANSYVDTGKYGGTKEYLYSNEEGTYYPNIFSKETTSWVNGTKGTKLNLSEQLEEDLVIGYTQDKNSIKITQKYWYKSMESSDFKNTMYYTLFINNGTSHYTTYWMSSRCVNADSNKASFLVHCVEFNRILAASVYCSHNNPTTRSNAFRPVITLKPNVSIGEGDGNTIPYELNM